VPVPPSLVFINSHFVSDKSNPIPSNIVRIGGIHLKPEKELPKDILKFIEDSPHGVILLTFGTIMKLSSLPNETLKSIKGVLSNLPQRVLLKYEGEMEDKPKNVFTSKWLPQRDILKHPNMKLFISHGGISGLYEAVDAGVPVLGFPLFSDQHRNIDNLVESGMAKSMDINSLTKDEFQKNIIELLGNENYTKNAKIASNIFKDRPMSPNESVVFWTEYVIRHNGAPHLKSQGLNLKWYQYFLLDVLAAMLVLMLISVFILLKIYKIMIECVNTFLKLIIKQKLE